MVIVFIVQFVHSFKLGSIQIERGVNHLWCFMGLFVVVVEELFMDFINCLWPINEFN